MEPKDFAMREAEQLEYAYRLPLYSTMELFIETLTGTCFELRVSPYETVISVKAKIQRLEGIPISQQYLIWQNTELEDEYCLHDYNITDGCTLKLVLAMRGGPINTRRIAMDDSGFSEMADYIESREELLEKLSPPPSDGNGSKQVTLLVYRDGDQLNFFRVVDRGDGTLTPFSESLSESCCNLRDDDDEEEDSEASSDGRDRKSAKQQPLSVAQMVENNITASKMKQIRSQMQNLHLNNSSNIKRKPQPTLQKLEIKSTREKPKQKVLKIAETISTRNNVLTESVQLERLTTPPSFGNETNNPDLPSRLTPSRIAVKRSQLKRMKKVGSKDEPEEAQTTCPNFNEVHKSDPIPTRKEESNLKASSVETEIESETDAKEDEGGRFSPRTKRLLNALESTSYNRRKTFATQTTAYKSPRSTMLQGMIYNRHDMYLRSYGLIASPDDVADERVASSASGEVAPSEKTKPPTKMYETPHGVKYSALPSKPHFGPESRILKTPPDWITSKNSPDRPGQVGGSWHPTPQPPYAGDINRNLDRTLRPPPASGRQSATSKTFYQKSHFDAVIGRSSTNANPEKMPPLDKPSLRKWLDLPHLPQPPSASSSSLATPSWQKQRLRRLNPPKPMPESKSGPLSPVVDNQNNLRRSFAQNSGKSGLRMKESPHGKVESMSREEAREVVDFINKAVDASILRTLVRSPVKDGKRGNSGQNSHRMPGSSNLQTPRSGVRPNKLVSGQPTLPPVKPASKKKRCFHCAKRTGLASSYLCRCGNNFCATHRYAESHNCTYDYKTSGRKLLEEANPLVSAPKLPKI